MAGKNPFPQVEDPADEPPFEPDPPKTSAPSDVAPAPAPTSDGAKHGGEVGASFKFGTGYEAPMIHFKAGSLAELADLMGYERAGEVGIDLFFGVSEFVAQGSKYVTEKYTEVTGRKVAESSKSGGGRPGRPAEAAQAPAWMGDAPLCKGHQEPSKYVTRTKDNGDRWHAWGCQRSKEEGSCGLDFRNAPKGK